MQYTFTSLFIGIILLVPTLLHASQKEFPKAKPFVIPEIKEWKGSKGTVKLSGRIVCLDKNPEIVRIARQFATDYATLSGKQLQVITSGKGEAGDLLLSIGKDPGLGKEGYTLRLADKVLLSAPHPAGIYWGTRTLLQMSEQANPTGNTHLSERMADPTVSAPHPGQTTVIALPRGEIRDYPDYAIRGLMIDCGRKFIPLHFLQDYIKILSYYKMNTLQIHLNDNGFKQFFEHNWDKTYAAFRLESDTYPGLTARDGHYTKQEFIELQQLAQAYGVEIIPEIDAPAHTLAFTRYLPEIGSQEYGMDHLDLFNPKTYEFMDGLLKEYLQGPNPVFRGPKVHIGTDEYSNKKTEVVEKFRYFTDHYIKYVESFGKQACIWGALTHAKGETPVKSENVIMSAWYNGYAAPRDMVQQGYKLISIPDGLLYIVPAAGYYYDYLNTKRLYESWTPAHVGKEVFAEKDPAILGGMFAVWNDHAGNGISTKDIHHRLYPALQTLAVKMWTGASPALSFTAFDTLRHALSEAPGVNQSGKIHRQPQPAKGANQSTFVEKSGDPETLGKSVVYREATVQPGSTRPHREVGYNYHVSFRIKGADETKGTELFRSPDAVFYLSDPISGLLGFARDGYLNTFQYRILPGEKVTVSIKGDSKSTRLYINGCLIEELNIQKRFYNGGKDSTNYVRTLVFPLEKAGDFKSSVTNLQIEQE